MLVRCPKTRPMMKIILVEARELLLLTPLHQSHSPNQLPNRSHSQNPKEKQISIWPITSPPKKHIRVRWNQIVIDRDRSESQVRGLNPDRVQAHYDDLLRATPPDCNDDLLLVSGVRIFCLVVFRLYSDVQCHLILLCTNCYLMYCWVLVCHWGSAHLHGCYATSQGQVIQKSPPPTWTREFEGFEVRRDTPLPIRRKLAGLHQVQTTSSSVSTTSKRMALLLEDLDAPLLTHTQNMLAKIGIIADEGNVVCSTFRLYPLHITVSMFFYPSLAVLRSL